MNNQETSKLLAVIKTAFPEFVITSETIQVWHLFLQKFPYDRAMSNLEDHILTSRFAPRIADVVREDLKQELTVYQIQQQENEQARLELQEYHETEKVGPMPDHIKAKLDAVFKKARVTLDES